MDNTSKSTVFDLLRVIIEEAEKDEKWKNRNNINKAFKPDEDIILTVSADIVDQIFQELDNLIEEKLLGDIADMVSPDKNKALAKSLYYGYLRSEEFKESHIFYTRESDSEYDSSVTLYYDNRPFTLFSHDPNVFIGLSDYSNHVFLSSELLYLNTFKNPLNIVLGAEWT